MLALEGLFVPNKVVLVHGRSVHFLNDDSSAFQTRIHEGHQHLGRALHRRTVVLGHDSRVGRDLPIGVIQHITGRISNGKTCFRIRLIFLRELLHHRSHKDGKEMLSSVRTTLLAAAVVHSCCCLRRGGPDLTRVRKRDERDQRRQSLLWNMIELEYECWACPMETFERSGEASTYIHIHVHKE